MLNRHQIRQVAFQTLFVLQADDSLKTQEAILKVLNIDNNDEATPETQIPEYLSQLVNGVLTNQVQLDAQITEKLKKGWQITRLSRPDLVLLRLGLYEMQNETQTPNKVVINEILELAKQFTDERAKNFINGVLTQFV